MYERLLEPGADCVPSCHCRYDMRHIKTERRSRDAAVKHFECDHCGRELHLMVWPEIALATTETVTHL